MAPSHIFQHEWLRLGLSHAMVYRKWYLGETTRLCYSIFKPIGNIQ